MDTYHTAELKQFGDGIFPKGIPEKYHGKRYETPPGYISTKIVGLAYALADLTHRELLRLQGAAGAYGKVMGDYLHYHDWQTYWLGRDIGRALLNTDVPGDTVIREVPLPFNAFTIMLPKGLLSTPQDGDIAWLSVASIDKDENDAVTGYAGDTRTSLMVWGMSFPDNGEPVNWDATAPQKMTVEEYLGKSVYQYRQGCGSEHPNDAQVPAKMLHLALNVCFYMAQDPVVIADPGKRTHTPAKKRREFLSPRWVGKRYKYPERHEGGTHLSPRAHWRRGHWRGVRHGSGRKQLRRMWIEPTLVNASGED